MPVVTVQWVAGRSSEQKSEVAKRITAAVADVGATSPSDVWVVFEDVAAGDWAVGGSLVSERDAD